MADKDNNEMYKVLVIIGTGLFLLWAFASFQEEVSKFSSILGLIIGPILMFLIYKIIKVIWPDFW